MPCRSFAESQRYGRSGASHYHFMICFVVRICLGRVLFSSMLATIIALLRRHSPMLCLIHSSHRTWTTASVSSRFSRRRWTRTSTPKRCVSTGTLARGHMSEHDAPQRESSPRRARRYVFTSRSLLGSMRFLHCTKTVCSLSVFNIVYIIPFAVFWYCIKCWSMAGMNSTYL